MSINWKSLLLHFALVAANGAVAVFAPQFAPVLSPALAALNALGKSPVTTTPPAK